MNNITPNSLKRYSYFPSSVPKTESNEAKKKTSSFYDDFRENANQIKKQTGFSTSIPALKLPDLTPQKTQPVSQNPETTGSAIKKNIESVLSQKYGELDTRHIFDGIDDKDIEDNLVTAENTIKTNIDRGALSKNILPKLPNLLDGLALSYAAANKGKSKAATRAREAAYTEQSEKETSDNLLLNISGNQPTKKPTNYSNFYDDYLKNKQPSRQNNNPWNTFDKTFDLPQLKNPRYVKADVLNMRSAPGTDSKVIGKLTDGTEVNYTGNKTKEIDGHLWAEVTYDGKTGWVAADYLKTEKPDAVSFDKEPAKRDVNNDGNPTGIRFKSSTQNKAPKNNSYDILKEALTKTDLDAGIKIAESSKGEYKYDYTDVIMNRVNEVLPDFLNHKIMSYPEYYKEFSNWLYSPTLQEYYAFYLEDYIFFFNQVNHGAPWDIKRDAPRKQQFGDIKMPYYDSNPNKDEKFLFRGKQVTREDLGNILYGYLGSAMGISDTTLYQGGGIAADWKNIFDGDVFDANEYYGDNSHDHNYIKKGIEMFYEDYPKAKS